jgi:hypothetical protein
LNSHNTWQDKSSESSRLRKEFPFDPVKWHDQVNVFFKAGEKEKAADLLHDAYAQFPEQTDLAFNQAYVRSELGQHARCVSILEALCGIRRRGNHSAADTSRRSAGPDAAAAAAAASGRAWDGKWVDQLIKCYVKAGRVGDAVRLADVQLRGIADPVVRARVVLTVYPWRFGAAVWTGAAARRAEVVAAAETALAMPAADADTAGLAMSPHNALIFLPAELGARAVARTVARTQPVAPLNGTWPLLRSCAACRCTRTRTRSHNCHTTDAH